MSLSDFLGLKGSFITFLKFPLLKPAGENHASLFASVAAVTPAVSPLRGM